MQPGGIPNSAGGMVPGLAPYMHQAAVAAAAQQHQPSGAAQIGAVPGVMPPPQQQQPPAQPPKPRKRNALAIIDPTTGESIFGKDDSAAKPSEEASNESKVSVTIVTVFFPS